MFTLDPLTIGFGVAMYLSFRNNNASDYGVMTPQREEVFRNCMEHCQNPEKMREYAKQWDKFGLKPQGNALRKRADWRDRSPEVRKAHDDVFAKAMKSENVAAVLEIAEAFEGMTATKKAAQLRQHAKDVEEAKLAPKVVVVETKATTVDKEKTNGKAEHKVEVKAEVVESTVSEDT